MHNVQARRRNSQSLRRNGSPKIRHSVHIVVGRESLCKFTLALWSEHSALEEEAVGSRSDDVDFFLVFLIFFFLY